MELDTTFYEEDDYLLLQLKKYLNYHVSASLLYFLSFFTLIALFIASLSALIFAIYLYYVLLKVKKYGWITFFTAVIIIPSIVSFFLIDKSEYTFTFLMIELGVFYFFCFIFRFVVNDWCEEISWKMLRNEEKKEEEKKEILSQKYLNNR
jgi:hypothetical protein